MGNNKQDAQGRGIYGVRVSFHTLGCKVNQFDSEGLISSFRENGFEVVSPSEEADLYIVNTCTVTKTAEQKARQLIRRLKRRTPEALVVVTGCYAQTNPEEVAGMPEADLVLGVAGRAGMVDIIREYLAKEVSKVSVKGWERRPEFEVYHPEFTERTRAFLKIEDGCESYCSYCKIPFARGPVRSLPPERVLLEIKRLLEKGFKELVLVGIHLGDYGKDLGTDLAGLLKKVETEIKGGVRIRLSSIEPTDFTPELIRVFAGSKLLCPHLHIPLQSGADPVLKRMNRHYGTGDYALLLAKLRQERPGLAVSSDLMVGFPGETGEDFHRTLEFIREQRFSRLHIFPYSPREGTRAAAMSGQLSRKVKEERAKRAEEVAGETAAEFRREFLGKVVEVLTEEEVEPGVWEGFSGEYLRVRIKGEIGVNRIISAKVTKAEEEPLMAVLPR